MRITAKARREAIEACLCRADEWIVDQVRWTNLPENSARAAYVAVVEASNGRLDGSEAWLEAAALLRGDAEHEPWSPGDAVYLLFKEQP